ncbi:MAG: hypothetical protein QM497_06240 [Sulfurimonas sp.]
MMEFFSFDLVKASIIGVMATGLAYVSVLSKGKRDKELDTTVGVKLFFLFVALVFISLPFIAADSYQTTAKENLMRFSNGAELICEGSDSNKYSVSSKNGWSRDKNYFTKDSLMIRADNCEER